MVNSAALLSDLQRLLGDFERDLREQVRERADVRAGFLADYEAARRVGRTQSPFDTWIEEPVTQAAVAWILGTVFARFLEDNGLVEPRLSGTGARHTRAVQEHQHYFQERPTEGDRDYLEDLFTRLSALPAMEALFDRRHNPLWRLPLSADAARQLVEFWQRIDPDLGRVAHDFADVQLDTRFLGDLYQDLSESVRKRYALLQTPEFVERFILDRTLTPAIETFGYREVRVIDSTCGSGHFLLGAFERLLALAQEHEPSRDVRGIVANVLSRIVGIDINPYAVAIARFRLTIAALRACGIARLVDAPGFDIPVAVADSLLHGPRFAEDGAVQMAMLPDDPANQYYFAEDEPRVRTLLGRQYHAVIGNPPYITVKDVALNGLYRQRYGSCSGQYALVVPFMERFFDLALSGRDGDAGFVGMIVGNSFMKRVFGKKLIERYLPKWDLTHVVDTSGAYIPGHGTPTVILFGRHRPPQTAKVRAVMGIRGEPSTPDDPGRGLVWTAILDQIDQTGSESAYVSVTDLERETLRHHPWSIGGGGATELKDDLDSRGERVLGSVVEAIGRVTHTGADDAYFADPRTWRRFGAPDDSTVAIVEGDVVRDWALEPAAESLFPYDRDLRANLPAESIVLRLLWPSQQFLIRRREPNGTHAEIGLTWYEWSRFQRERFLAPLTIAFAFVATHNHFVLDRGGKVFTRSAPVIKLSAEATEEDHLGLLGLLNSSIACFWLKQVSHNKGSTVDEAGARQRTVPFEDFWEFTTAGLEKYPLVGDSPVHLARALASLAERAGANLVDPESGRQTRSRDQVMEIHSRLIALQEELDWFVYRSYGVTRDPLVYSGTAPGLKLGQRAFEILMARQISAGELETTWFDRHGSTPSTELPAEWPDDYRCLVEKRIDLIERDRYIGLIEQPEYKRRWNLESFDERLTLLCHLLSGGLRPKLTSRFNSLRFPRT